MSRRTTLSLYLMLAVAAGSSVYWGASFLVDGLADGASDRYRAGMTLPARNPKRVPASAPDEPGVAVSAIDADEEARAAGSQAPPKPADGIGKIIEQMAPGVSADQVPRSRPPELTGAEGEAIALPRRNPARITLAKMIGQMLIFGFQGTRPEQKWPSVIARQLRNGEISGVILLKYNLDNPRDARRLMGSLYAAGQKAAQPAFLVLDQEGGAVQRLGPRLDVAKIPRARAVAAKGGEEARRIYAAMAASLRQWRFNVNLGPVVDLDIDPNSPAIGKYGRSFSPDPQTVLKYAGIFVEEHKRRGLLTVLKHFPGHGSSKRDSHLGFTDISATWKKIELEPFKKMIERGQADMVMVGHLYLDQYDDGAETRYPTSLSRKAITVKLRKELGFDGVVISDDMEMGAIRKNYRTGPALIRAIKSGTDLLIISNSANPDINLARKYTDSILEAAEKDPALRDRIRKSYRRVVKLKRRLR